METLLGILAETIISLLINDLAQQPRWAALREKISGESPQRLALQYALAKTYGAFAEKYPDLAHSFFDKHFLKQPEVAAELAKLLTPAGMADPATLIQLWQAQFRQPIEIELADKVDFFIQRLNSEIKDQPNLKPFVDSRAFDQLYQIAESGEQQVATLDEIRQLLATTAEFLKTLSAQPHIHINSQGGPVIIGDVHTGRDFVGRDVTHVDVPAQAHSSPENPFIDKLRINEPDQFFGRQQIIRELQQSLDRGNSIALIGPSGVGKSSLLYYLYMTHAEWLHNNEVIYLDLHKLQDEKDLCGKIQEKLTPLHPIEPRSGREALRAIRKILEQHQVLLILDEVDELVQGDFKLQLQKLLRSLIQDGTLSLLVACKYEINKVFTPSNPTSPLHNVFESKTLANFSRTEMNDFIRARLDPTGIHFTPEEMAELWRNTAGHPDKVQREAATFFNRHVLK